MRPMKTSLPLQQTVRRMACQIESAKHALIAKLPCCLSLTALCHVVKAPVASLGIVQVTPCTIAQGKNPLNALGLACFRPLLRC